MDVLTTLILAFFLAFIPAFIAKSKGRNFFLWHLYGFAFFIIALIHSLLISKTPEKIAEDYKEKGYVECPFCKEFIKKDAVICPHCHKNLKSDATV